MAQSEKDKRTETLGPAAGKVSLGLQIMGGEPAAPPLVSVLIPTFNRAWSLEGCVRSIYDQTYRSIECIIVDDGSTDDTPTVIERLKAAQPDGIVLRYFRKDNGGANTARNRALVECRGDYICYLDSDDTLTPDSVEARARVLTEDPSVDFCYGRCSVRDKDGNEIAIINDPWPSGEEAARIATYLFHTNAPMIRRAVCAETGLWREDDLHAQEYEYFARLKFFSKRVVYLDRVLSYYVRHDKGSIFDKSQAFCRALYRLLFAIKALILFSAHDRPAERAELAREFHKVGKGLYRTGDHATAAQALRESLILDFRFRVWAQQCLIRAFSAGQWLVGRKDARAP